MNTSRLGVTCNLTLDLKITSFAKLAQFHARASLSLLIFLPFRPKTWVFLYYLNRDHCIIGPIPPTLEKC